MGAILLVVQVHTAEYVLVMILGAATRNHATYALTRRHDIFLCTVRTAVRRWQNALAMLHLNTWRGVPFQTEKVLGFPPKRLLDTLPRMASMYSLRRSSHWDCAESQVAFLAAEKRRDLKVSICCALDQRQLDKLKMDSWREEKSGGERSAF